MKLFLMAASQRKESFNKKLILNCHDYLSQNYELDLANMEDYNLPGYNGDIESSQGVPELAKKLSDRILAADKIIFSVPEYNYSIPGVFKNIIDWISRIKPMPWKGRRILLITASPSIVGGNRSFWHTNVPLIGCGAIIHPGFFSLSFAHEQFDESHKIKNQDLLKELHKLLDQFVAN